MRVLLATEPAAPDRPNEDFAAVAPGIAVLLDGAGIPEQDNGCVHGVAWYARTLGGLLVAGACDDSLPLRELLGRDIGQVARLHADTCDLRNPATPSATVIITRCLADRLEYLVLCDSVLILQPRDGEPRAVSDTRLDELIAALRPERLSPDAAPGERDAQRWAYGRKIDAARNQPGGFWIAGSDPEVAGEALTGDEPIESLSAVALLSDGASRLADRYDLATWAGICAILAEHGPEGLIGRVRAAETSDPDGSRWPRSKLRDDATVAYWRITD